MLNCCPNQFSQLDFFKTVAKIFIFNLMSIILMGIHEGKGFLPDLLKYLRA